MDTADKKKEEFEKLNEKFDKILSNIQQLMSSGNFCIVQVSKLQREMTKVSDQRFRLFHEMMGCKTSLAGCCPGNV